MEAHAQRLAVHRHGVPQLTALGGPVERFVVAGGSPPFEPVFVADGLVCGLGSIV